MLKKISNFFTVVIIFAVVAFALGYQVGYYHDLEGCYDFVVKLLNIEKLQTSDDFEYELIEAEKTINVGTINSDLLYGLTSYKDILEASNDAYLWISPTSGNASQIESVSKDEFNNRMLSSTISEEDLNLLRPCFDADELREKARLTIETLTHTANPVKSNLPGFVQIYVSYNGSSKIDCFNGHIIGAAGMEGMDGEDKFFENNGLSLKCRNVKVGTLVSGTKYMNGGGEYIAKVSAEVTCKINDGTFKELSWIPDEGETERIEFLVYFFEINTHGFTQAIIRDIVVLN